MPTETSQNGVGRRESHNASKYYARRINAAPGQPGTPTDASNAPLGDWADQVYCQSSERMEMLPDRSIGLAFTSPPYAVGKSYDLDYSLTEYVELLRAVGSEVYRTLVAGGRYVVNIANVGRKPYIPMVAHLYGALCPLGFLPVGEIIWQKAPGAAGNCAWGSFKSASAPNLRDLHEYLVVFSKETFKRADRGVSTVGRDEFMRDTLSVWNVKPESAKRIGHPAPFPIELAKRVIHLFSYQDDCVLDPFCGSGTTLVAAHQAGRHYVGFDTVSDYCELSRARIAAITIS